MKDCNVILYKSGLLDKLLRHANDEPQIKNYLEFEAEYLIENIGFNEDVIDFCCGYGRHLQLLENKIKYGFGIDVNHTYIENAKSLNKSRRLHFSVPESVLTFA